MAKIFRDGRMRNAAGKPAYVLLYRGLDGKYHRERTAACTREEAEGLLRRKLRVLVETEAKGLRTLDHLKPTSFETFYNDKYLPGIEEAVRESTLKRKKHLAEHVLPFFGKMPLRAINAGHVRDYMAKRFKATPKPSNREVNMERGLVSAVLNEAFRHGLVDVNEAARVRPLRENVRDLWLKPEEVEHVLAKAEPWVKPFILLAVNTGLRAGELCNLRWEDLEHSPGFIRVGEESKTHRARFVPINSAAKAVLDAQTRRIGPEGSIPFVLPNPRRRGAYRPNSVYHDFTDAAEKAAEVAEAKGRGEEATRLRAATVHTLRHTFASWAIQRGIPIAEVQQFLGHASDVMTRRYAHLAPASKERRNVLEALIGDVDCEYIAQDLAPKAGAV